ncbi:MAG: peptide chain release factor N(5)-glutamine methyltransferase [Gammaproteobacteria bacterium]|nr:peptide chain release factor N(5)-glutamine methyltransferase [Gammaproteobacteria bacterium]
MPNVGAWLSAHADLPRLDCEILLAHRLASARAGIIAHPERELNEHELATLDADAAALRDGMPLAYLTGRREFWGLEFDLTRDVLVPRPETETLVEAALAKIQSGQRILDLGTGSGAVAIAIAKSADIAVHASDNSTAAVCIARENARKLGVDVHFDISDWFSAVTGLFHLIVTNPPYVAEGDPHLPALRFEPTAALISGQDGLDAIRTIVKQAVTYLEADGWLLVEHGCDQAASVRQLFATAGFAGVATLPDLSGQDRVTLGQHNRSAEV